MTTPPPLFLQFEDPQMGRRALAASLPATEVEKSEQLAEVGLPPVTSIDALAVLTGFSPRLIGAMIRNPDRYYRQFVIQNGRKYRTIHSPRISLKIIQKWLGYHISRWYKAPPQVHGFVPGKSIITAAQTHCGAEWTISVDVRDFFPSINRKMVQAQFTSLGYPGHAPWLLSWLTTLNNSVPQGSPASPVLSNLVFGSTDVRLAELASSHGYSLSRYADDITFSGVGKLPDFVEEIEAVLNDAEWGLAHEKTDTASRPNSLRVLGLLVDGEQPRLPRRYRHRLRMMKYILDKENAADKELKFKGHIAFAKSVNPSI